MVSAAAALLIFCAPFEPAAARRTELFPFGDLFGIHPPKHRRVKQEHTKQEHANFVPLPQPRPADAPVAPLQGRAENRSKKRAAEAPVPAPPAPPEPAKPQASEAEKANQPKPAPTAEPPKEKAEEAPPAPAPPSACRLALTDQIAIAPSIPDIHGPGDCGGEDLVRLEAVVLSDKRRVTLKPAATLRCKMASEIADWVRTDIAPLAAGMGSEVSTLDNFDSYDCRGRNSVSGAKLSEHGHANAIDVHGFDLANGQSIVLTDSMVPRELRENVLHSACTRFTTVLGPGSDGHHEDHIHLDLIARHNDYRICEWNVYDPMPQVAPLLPVARPDEAPPRQVDANSQVSPHVNSGAATSDKLNPDDVKSNDVKPDPVPTDRPGQHHAKPDQTKPDQAEPEHPKRDHGKRDEAKPARAESASTKSGEAHTRTHKPPTKKRRINRRFEFDW